MRIAFHIGNALFLAAFIASTLVQLNDPDPIRWIAIYVVATVVTALAWWRLPWFVPALVAVIAVAWGLALLPGARGATLAGIFGDMKMKSQEVELAREGLGLLIVGAWMTFLTVRSRRLVRTPIPD